MSDNQAAAPYRVLARKYRPQSFDDLIGQEPMVRTLSNAFRSGRIAQAYMLTGVRGVGKTTTARILARALNYRKGDLDQPVIDMREEGEHCRAIMEGRHVDVIEMDAASHTGIDDIRDIIEAVQYAPALARYKVYIIDEVHMLSRNAFNGLLKTLEEPPAHLKFIFATTEIRKVPVTVLSRCQRFDLRRIETGIMIGHLAKICGLEGIEAEEEALAMLARASEGSVRDALSMMDQAIAHAGGMLKAEEVRNMLGLADRTRVIGLFEHVMRGDIAAALAEMKDQYDTGADPHVVLTDLGDFIHYVTRLKYTASTGGPGEAAGLSEVERSKGREFAARLSVRVLGRAWQILLKGLQEIRDAERPLAAADMLLVRLTHAVDLPGHEELVEKARNQPPGGGALSRGQALPHGSAGGSVSSLPQQGSGPSRNGSGGNPPVAAAPAEMPLKSEAPDQPAVLVSTFEELLALADQKRDLKAKTFLRRHVRLVSMRPGLLEFNQSGNPPRDQAQYLKACLENWTGMRWTIAVSSEDGLPTVEEIERAELDQRLQSARTNPAVEAILKAFEGARIVDVRIREKREALPSGPEAGESGEEGLDDFFE